MLTSIKTNPNSHIKAKTPNIVMDKIYDLPESPAACETTDGASAKVRRPLRIAIIAHSLYPIAQPYAGGLEMITQLI